MPARDIFHEPVRQSLIKDGWTITADPLVVQFGGVNMYVDLGAERLIAAERGEERIAVEIKSFLGLSVLNDFHLALGQFLNYRLALDAQEPERILYLAVPVDTFNAFFTLPFAQAAVQRHGVKIVVFNPEQETVVQWTS